MMLRETRATAPGKIILFGEHSVVYGRRAIAACVSELRVEIRLTPRKDSKIVTRVWNGTETESGLHQCAVSVREAEFFGSERKSNISVEEATKVVRASTFQAELLRIVRANSAKSEDSHVERAHCVLLFLSIAILRSQYSWNHFSKFGGLTLTVCGPSQIPVGAGLGSSAALCVASSAALLWASGGDRSDSSLTDKDRQSINAWAFVGETYLHGTPSGVDNTVSTYGGAVCFRKKTSKTDAPAWKRLSQFPKLRMIVTNTLVPRETRALVQRVARLRNCAPKAMDAVFDAVDAIVAECLSMLAGDVDDEKREYSRASVESKLSLLISMNQSLLIAMGVGHAAISKVCETMESVGKLSSSKLTGAGGGGCVITLVPSSGASEEAISAAKAATEKHGFRCEATSIGGDGVRVSSEAP